MHTHTHTHTHYSVCIEYKQRADRHTALAFAQHVTNNKLACVMRVHSRTHTFGCVCLCVCVKWVTRSHRVRYYVMRYEFFALPVAVFNVSWIKSCSRVEPQRKRERERERKKRERLTKSGGERKRICVQAIKSSELRQPLMCICMHIQPTHTYVRLVMVQRSVWLLFRLIKRTQCAAK